MNNIYVLCFFVLWGNVNGQQSNLNQELMTYPVSPEAARMATYGSVPVNLFTGKLQKDIPLFNGKIGDFNLPVKIIYNYSGNRVEETPSIMGLGWQLNAGGVVTREVRGLPDHYDNNYYNFKTSSVGNNLFNLRKIRSVDADKILNGLYDTEPDLYRVSVNGIHFSFKIGLNGSPVFLSKHNNIINVVRSLQNNNHIVSFILTDSNSNKYYFEDIETSEQIAGQSYEDPNSFFDLMHPIYSSSWQLTKIVTNNNSLINYSYQNDDLMSYSFSHSGTKAGYITNTCPGCISDNYQSVSNVFIIHRKILTGITCNLFTIDFSIGLSEGTKIYNEIKIQNTSEILKYNFQYEGARNYLIQVNKNNSFMEGYEYNGVTSSFVNSEYYNVKNQDLWGFANNANNSYLVNVPHTPYQSDRNPNFYETLIGSLSTINYITGGKTNIIYELNSIPNNTSTIPNVRIDLKFKTDNLLSAPPIKEVSIIKTFDTDVVAELSHNISSKNFINMSIQSSDCYTNGSLPYYVALPALRNDYLNEIPYFCPTFNFFAQHDECTSAPGCPAPCNCTIDENSGGKFILPAGTYKFKISSEYNRTQNANGEIVLDFYDVNIYPTFREKPVGGLRVRRTIDTSEYGNEITKYYEYKNIFGASSGHEYSQLLNSNLYTEIHGNLGNSVLTGCFTYPNNIIEYSSNSLNPLLNNGTPVYYKNVKEYTSSIDIFSPNLNPFVCESCENTSTINNFDGSKVYSYIGDYYGTITKTFPNGFKTYDYKETSKSPYYKIPEGEDLSLGIIEREQTFSSNIVNNNNEIIIDNKTDYLEQLNAQLPLNFPEGIKVRRKILYTGCQNITPDTPEDPYFLCPIAINNNYDFDSYKESDFEYLVNNINTKEYFYNNQPIEKNISIDYDSHNQQHIITTSDSNFNTQTNELYYPYDFTDATSQNMVTKNFITPIVKIVNKKSGNIIDSYKYDFTAIGSNLFKPSLFWKSKGNGVLEKLSAYGYDSKGNVNFIQNIESETQVPPHTITNGPTTVVIWGYNDSQPIAKIENVAGVTISPSLINDAKDKSNTGTEAQLITSLNNLRNSLPNAMVTTYTHKPLVGVSTITDPKGDTITYIYDSFNRLKEIKDKNGNKLSENEYHYRP